jgi:hypothetical protein
MRRCAVANDGAADRDALHLTAREFVGLAVEEVSILSICGAGDALSISACG